MEEDNVEQVDNEKIKSTAIVKYSLPKPAQFIKLQCNTDLNLPPSNWLSSSVDCYGLQHVVLYHPEGFTSFRMAQMFPDCIGEVDVVSDAENIKKLLKLPYDKGHISMMVHRIENTLLLDNFDIYKHLLKTAESEWEWLKKFFVENINRATCEEDKNLYTKNRRREALIEKSLVSKFLYHSLAEDDVKEHKIFDNTGTRPIVEEPILPEPSPITELPNSSKSDQNYNRNVVWTFEDIEMLIGTNMPIFGGGTHPCISLRLNDMSKPINVLTGIDYWLDNLMSNVPEVVMCYHLNGIVQKYELIKTEDLPRMDDSKFSPKLIRDVAQSILSFLKSNATKAGHTYWLFKGKDEEVVKLYDLTSLCSEKDVEKGQNPFTIPVAMLLYRVARNMKHSADRRQSGIIKMLLKNCLKLLSAEKYPDIVTSSLYMLSDLYVPADTNPEHPGLEETEQDDENESVYEDDLSETNGKDEAMKTLVLGNSRVEKFQNYNKPPPPIQAGVEERCLQAIQHVADGLNCLKYFPKQEENARAKEEEEIKMAKPFEPIPMPYGKLNEEKVPEVCKKNKRRDRKKKSIKTESENALLPKNKNEARHLPTWSEKVVNISWKDHLKTLLYEKAVLVYATLSEYHFVQGSYGSCLRTIGLLARSQLVMNKLQYTSNALRENCLLGRAGDCAMMIVENWLKQMDYRTQYYKFAEEDFKMMEQIIADEKFYNISIGDSNLKCVFLPDIRTIEQMLLKSIEWYEEALKLSESESIMRRLGNSLNEVAMYFLHVAKEENPKDAIFTCKKAKRFLERGLEIFEKIKDVANTALLYTNMGHLQRLLAYALSPTDRGELTAQEKLYYNKAFLSYKKALRTLNERKSNPGVWDAVSWELSTTIFNMAMIMYEYPSKATGDFEVEKEIIEAFQKALKYCEFGEDNTRYPLYLYRAAVIHDKIASLYHNYIFSSKETPNRKSIIQLAKINYEKAGKFYLQSLEAKGYLKSQMQRFALCEYLSLTASKPISKFKHLQEALDITLEMQEMIELLVEKKVEMSKEEDDEKSGKYDNGFSLLMLIVSRLQHILKTMIKLCITKPPATRDCAKLADLYKDCYRATFELTDDLGYDGLLEKLHKALKEIRTKTQASNL